MTKRIVLPCLVGMLVTSHATAVAQDNPMDAFKPLLGTWTTTSESRPSLASPQKSTGAGELNVSLILNGRFVQIDGYGSSPLIERKDYHVIMTYDERRRTYRRWMFRSDGVVAESNGVWDPEKKTLTWSTLGLPASATFTVTTRITDGGFEETLFGKQADGTVSMDLTLTAQKKP